MFDKRHYEFMAKALLHAASNAVILNRHAELSLGIRYMANYLCDQFAMDNPNFKQGKFLHACGLTEDDTH